MVKIFTLFLFLVLTAGFLFVLTVSKAANAQSSNTDPHVPGQILVEFKTGVPSSMVNNVLQGVSAKQTGSIDKLHVLIISVPKTSENTVLTTLQHNPNVDYAEFNYIGHAFLTPNDTYFAANQWFLQNTGQVINGITGTVGADIKATQAYDISEGSSNVRVAILDSGINVNHEDLAGKIVANTDFTNSSSGYLDVYGHGTHVAGIVGAVTNNGLGVASVCPDCALLNGKIINDNGSVTVSNVANGITWAIANKAKVINLSLGWTTGSRTLLNAVNYAWNNGAVVVAAAGNLGNTNLVYPASYQNVISVAATDNTDQLASFSTYGTWVDMAAPGDYVFSTWKDSTSNLAPQPVCDANGYCYKFGHGTSMSAPVVAGIVGLVFSYNPSLTNAQVESIVENSADKISGTGTDWIYGRADAYKALVAAGNVTVTPTPTPTPTVSVTVTPTPTPKPHGKH